MGWAPIPAHRNSRPTPAAAFTGYLSSLPGCHLEAGTEGRAAWCYFFPPSLLTSGQEPGLETGVKRFGKLGTKSNGSALCNVCNSGDAGSPRTRLLPGSVTSSPPAIVLAGLLALRGARGSITAAPSSQRSVFGGNMCANPPHPLPPTRPPLFFF